MKNLVGLVQTFGIFLLIGIAVCGCLLFGRWIQPKEVARPDFTIQMTPSDLNPKDVSNQLSTAEAELAALREEIDNLKGKLQEREWDETITAVFTLIIGMAAFFFTWLAISDYRKNIHEEAERVVAIRIKDLSKLIDGRVAQTLGLVMARLTWVNGKTLHKRADADFADMAVDRLKRAKEALEQCVFTKREAEAPLDNVINNLAYYAACRANESDAQETLDLAEQLRRKRGFSRDPVRITTYISVYLAYFDPYASDKSSAEKRKKLQEMETMLLDVLRDKYARKIDQEEAERMLPAVKSRLLSLPKS